MVPGWQAKISKAVLPHRRRLAGEIAKDIRGNLIDGGHVVTGDLLGSVKHVGSRVFIGTDHWEIIEYGSQPHAYTVKRRRVMSDRVNIYGTRVKHPGTRAYAPVRRATYTRRALTPIA
jgi:hypothetical protein